MAKLTDDDIKVLDDIQASLGPDGDRIIAIALDDIRELNSEVDRLKADNEQLRAELKKFRAALSQQEKSDGKSKC